MLLYDSFIVFGAVNNSHISHLVAEYLGYYKGALSLHLSYVWIRFNVSDHHF